ncbi:MAG: DUF2178 domain-containing protein [Clostridiales bacterium]|jgi:hypothetical protein|nr:DUF2178 domain-containing protein [Clostridiales bacterium]
MNEEKFRVKVKQKATMSFVIAALGLLLLNASRLDGYFVPENFGYVSGYYLGVSLGFIFGGVIHGIILLRLLKNETKVKTKFLEATDERNIAINEKSAVLTLYVGVIGLLFATFFMKTEQEIQMLLYTAFGLVLVYLFAKMFYNNKM